MPRGPYGQRTTSPGTTTDAGEGWMNASGGNLPAAAAPVTAPAAPGTTFPGTAGMQNAYARMGHGMYAGATLPNTWTWGPGSMGMLAQAMRPIRQGTVGLPGATGLGTGVQSFEDWLQQFLLRLHHASRATGMGGGVPPGFPGRGGQGFPGGGGPYGGGG